MTISRWSPKKRVATPQTKSGQLGYTPAFFPAPSRKGLFDRWLWRWDGRTGKRLSNIRYVTSRAIRFLWFGLLWAPVVRGIVRECCSLPGRIGTICATKLYQHGVCFGSPELPTQRISDEQTLACIRDTQRITSEYRWATILDLALSVQAWKAGAEWALSSPSCTPLMGRLGKESLACSDDLPSLASLISEVTVRMLEPPTDQDRAQALRIAYEIWPVAPAGGPCSTLTRGSVPSSTGPCETAATYTDAVRIHNLATPEEKPLLDRLLRIKRANQLRRYGAGEVDRKEAEAAR